MKWSSRVEKLGSVGGTNGGGTGSQKRRVSSRCSSTIRRPMCSGRSGSARGLSAAHVSVVGRFGCGRANGLNSPVASSYIRSTIVGVSEVLPSDISDNPCRTFIDTSQQIGPPAAAIRRRS